MLANLPRMVLTIFFTFGAGVITHNSGVIARNSGVIAPNSGVNFHRSALTSLKE
jgi:hypothetical protein